MRALTGEGGHNLLAIQRTLYRMGKLSPATIAQLKRNELRGPKGRKRRARP
jgi:hypothetical protein